MSTASNSAESTRTPSLGFEDGRTNFWYSFDYGLAHFVSFDGETDYYQPPESPFVAELTGNETYPTEDETFITNAGPFGFIDGSYKVNENYEQVRLVPVHHWVELTGLCSRSNGSRRIWHLYVVTWCM